MPSTELSKKMLKAVKEYAKSHGSTISDDEDYINLVEFLFPKLRGLVIEDFLKERLVILTDQKAMSVQEAELRPGMSEIYRRAMVRDLGEKLEAADCVKHTTSWNELRQAGELGVTLFALKTL